MSETIEMACCSKGETTAVCCVARCPRCGWEGRPLRFDDRPWTHEEGECGECLVNEFLFHTQGWYRKYEWRTCTATESIPSSVAARGVHAPREGVLVFEWAALTAHYTVC